MIRTLSIEELDSRIAAETNALARTKLEVLRPFAIRNEALAISTLFLQFVPFGYTPTTRGLSGVS